MPARTIVYVDGFNLYYGALKHTNRRWLNLQRYFEMVRPHDHISRINYFTARVNGPSGVDQLTYLNALETLPKVTIIEGILKGSSSPRTSFAASPLVR